MIFRPLLRTSLVLAAVVLAAAGLLACGNSSEGTPPSADEVRLDADVAIEARRAQKLPAPEPDRPAPVEPSEDEPPARIVRENRQLRRDLENLKALEAANRRVERRLAKLGGFDGPLNIGAGGLAMPVNGPVVSPFGQRWGRLHAGIDIAAPAGRGIRAAAAGKVVLAGPTSGYGNYVCIAHNQRVTTCYAHLSEYLTQAGEILSQGDPVGLVGCTGHCFGDHLHFEVRVDGSPVDPLPYLR